MKSVTQAFKDAQAAPSSVSVRRVSYKRRYWVQSSQSYVWETSWVTMTEDEVISVSAITAKLDTEAVNEYKVSNVTINLKNADRRWNASNPFGRFGKDSQSPVFGYEPYWTKFRIESGYVVNGVDTFTPLFVGVAVDFQTDGNSDACQISVRGLEALLENANAELVSTAVDNETPSGTVNGTNKDFVTLQPGVGIVSKVTVDGLEKKAGTEYTVSDLDTPTLGAKITLATAPTGGQVVKVWYRYWQQNKTIESLVTDLISEAKLNNALNIIETVVFPTGVNQVHAIDSQGDWNLGTKTDVDVNRTPGDLKIDFSVIGNKTLLDDFNSGLSGSWTTSGTASIVSNKLRLGNDSDCSSAHRASTKNIGVWQVTVTHVSGYGFSPNFNKSVYFYFMGGTVTTGSTWGQRYLRNGYALQVNMKFGPDNIYLLRYDNDTATGNPVVLGSASSSIVNNGTVTISVGRNPGGSFSVYENGSLLFTAQDNTYTTSANMMLASNNDGYSPSGGTTWDFEDLYHPSTTASGTWVSPVFDCLSVPTSWGNMVVYQTKNGTGSLTYSTRTSTDGSTWDSYVTVSGTWGIGSAIKRYVQLKIEMTSGLVDSDDYSVQLVKIFYFNSVTQVKMASFTGKTVYNAIQSLGAFANYEWGFKEDETFFFRSKEVSPTLDEILDTSINLVDVTSVNNGYDRVYHEVQSEFGSFNVTLSTANDIPTSPLPRFGKRRFSVSNSEILLAQDTDVATGIARGLLNYLSIPRRTCKAKTKLMEWLDLSDTVLVNFRDKPNNWWMGDTHVYLGQTDIHLHGPESNTLDGFLAKVVGYRHDTESKTSEFDLEEIIQ